MYELGFANVFGIPRSFITVDSTKYIMVLGTYIPIVIVAFWFTFIVLPKTKRINTDNNDEYLKFKGMGMLSFVLTPEGNKKIRDFIDNPEKGSEEEV